MQFKVFPSYLIICLMLLFQTGIVAAGDPKEDEGGGAIDVVFVVDISGSTGGILEAVRGKFWQIQNELVRLDPTPDYRLGIVCMGRPSFKKENNYVSVISDLTDDIDAAAHPFFKIKDVTAPGNYFMGHALDVAVNEISWSEEPNAIKLMFLVGNGKPSAGPGFRKPLRDAKEKGITIHSLYFQTYFNQTEQAEWKAIAEDTGGKFNVIGSKDPQIVFTKTYDGDLLREANSMINSTYKYYGPQGFERQLMQVELDEDAELLGEEQVEARSFFKASHLYQGKNKSWDMIDLKKSGKDPTSKTRRLMEEEFQDLPNEEMEQRLTEIEYERSEYISIIKLLSQKREEFLKDKREKMKKYRFGKTFFGVVNRTLIETFQRHGYTVNY